MFKKVLFLFLVLFVLFSQKNKILADDKIDLCVVYEKEEYDKGDKINLSFDLPKFSNLFSVIIRIEYNNQMVLPLSSNDCYFNLNNHSIFNDFVVNKKINDNTLYAEFLKNNLDDGYYSSYKNNLCVLEFNALTHIENVLEIIDIDKIQIFLFDTNHNLINYSIKFVKQLDASFINNKYEINVFSDELILDNIFYVNNRNVDDYIIFEEKTINNELLGTQIYQVGVFDKITGKYTSYSTIIEVLDQEAPTMMCDDEIDILDIDLENVDLQGYISVFDNYDKDVVVKMKYYNENGEIIETDYKTQILSNLRLKVGFTAIDSSFNESIEKIVIFNLVDTTPPQIQVNDVKIKDVDILNYNILDDISITDNLDKDPQLIISFYNSNNEVIDDYKKVLNIKEYCYLVVKGFDKFQNQSKEIKVRISLVDTISPELTYNELTYINDVDIKKIDLTALIDVLDNDDRQCKISYELYSEDEVIDLDELKTKLLENITCQIKYFVYDYSLNMSSCIINVKIKDTTPPMIYVNIEQDKIYKQLNEIEYNISDNLTTNIKYEILVNGEIYQGDELLEGTYNLVITASDEAGNQSVLERYFIVSSKGIISNVLNGNINVKSNYIIIGIIICSVIIGLIKIRFDYSVRKKKS